MKNILDQFEIALLDMGDTIGGNPKEKLENTASVISIGLYK